MSKTDIPEALNLHTLPQPRTPEQNRMVAERLGGHTTSPEWLPEGLWPTVDEFRAEQHRLLRRIGADMAARRDLVEAFEAEDRVYQDKLREAARSGAPAPDDERTPETERVARGEPIDKAIWAGLEVLAELADRVIAYLREHEDEFLADLRSHRSGAEEDIRRAQALVERSRAKEFRIANLGRWLQATTDGEAFGRQPAPPLAPAPDAFRLAPDALERPWHRRKPWNKRTEEAA